MRLPTLALSLLLAAPALAGTLQGVTLPDTVTVDGQPLLLNGMGLREKYYINVYVGGLYLPEKTTDAQKAINDDVHKRIVMVMTRDIPGDKLAETMRESLSSAADPEARKHANTLAGWMEDMKKGERITLSYSPSKGCSVTVKDTLKGTLKGAAVMRALWGVYLGPKPPTEALKKGMMGG